MVSWQPGAWDLLNSYPAQKVNDMTLRLHSNHMHDLPEGMIQVTVVSICMTVR